MLLKLFYFFSVAVFSVTKASYVYDDLMEKRQYFNNMLPEMSVMEPVFGRRKATLRRRLQNYIRANRRSSV
ncbi:Oidioi.mRNA.OKI2018_I69.chr2.g4183.t1.cds [Oikopleura dioica]|uniref:Oidioi.mRNA.OKI2018_I69.chr2.g4183.t1.cds n=1 Tax=Oikopleura dioica TaxID=34765 RepID=A0ABN7T211_OIKDI|nr:Oidioi.mRNA.OKI2018_I69.chr2.g4183.t1.cds [Oikopleura dioica]